MQGEGSFMETLYGLDGLRWEKKRQRAQVIIISAYLPVTLWLSRLISMVSCLL